MGTWFNYADTQVNDDFEIDNPGGTWADQSCAVVHTGGASESATEVTYAGVGLELSGGDGYDASGYTGVRIKIESDEDVYLSITTSDGGHYGLIVAGGTVGSATRSVSFASMVAAGDNAGTKDLTSITQINIDAVDPTRYGYAIHRIEFY